MLICGICIWLAAGKKSLSESLGPYHCLKADDPIQIDGKLDESAWKKASSILFREIVTGTAPKYPSEAKIIWDERYIYIGMVFQDPNVWATVNLEQNAWHRAHGINARHEMEIMEWDAFGKIFLDPDADGQNYVEFHINPYNSVYDCYFTSGCDALGNDIGKRLYRWQWTCSNMVHKVNVDGTLNDFTDTDKGWSFELAIPWQSLASFINGNCPPKPGDIWKAHLGRVSRNGPGNNRQYWTWPVIGLVHCHIPAKWQTIEFVDPTSALNTNQPTIWRGGWAGPEKNPQTLVEAAHRMGFTALISGGGYAYLNNLCSLAKEKNIEVYYWFHITGTPGKKEYWQVVSPEEAEKSRKIDADKTPDKHEYQYGGEPVNKATDVNTGEFLCFHRPEVVAYCRKTISDAVTNCPGLAGVAFDYFGYKNYRRCHCPVSESQFEEYYKRLLKGKMPRERALEQFALDTLVDFNNSLADYIRGLKPAMKIVTHVYPTFIANPVYGNRLDVDYCCQTVAWYFEPFWDLHKVDKYTCWVVQDAQRYYARPQGIPFVGIYMDKPGMSKPPERFRQELKTIRKAGSQCFSICPFNIFIQHPELGNILMEELGTSSNQ